MHAPDDPTSTAKCRQTCTHPGTVNAVKTCSAAIHGTRTHLMIAGSNAKSIIIIIYIKKWVLLEGLGEQVGFQLELYINAL